MIDNIDKLKKIANDFIPEIKFIVKETSPVGNHSIIDENDNCYIVWDKSFWDYFDKVFYLLDTLKYEDEKDDALKYELTINLISVIYNHLSIRYRKIKDLSSELSNIATKYGYYFVEFFYNKDKNIAILKEDREIITDVCMILALLHEIAHIKLNRDENLKKELSKELTHNIKVFFKEISSIDNVANIIVNHKYYQTNINKKYIKNLLKKLTTSQPGCVFEELLCDYFAFMHAFRYLSNNGEYNFDLLKIISVLESSMILFYTVIMTYTYMCELWSELPISYFISPNQQLTPSKENLFFYLDDYSIIRISFFPSIIMCLLIKIATDSNKEFKNYYYNFKKSENYISNNIDLFIYLFGLSLNKNFLQEVFNNITIYLDSNKVFSSYINSQETTVVATWLSNQYHNNLGINFLNNKDYESALIEFYKTIVICESIKCMGHWHRFTARAYNNTVSALIGLYNKNANFPQCITNDSLLLPVINLIGSKSSEYAYFAKLYVDIAVEIIQHCKCKDDVQAMYIYHNAGSVYIIYKEFSKAIKYFTKSLSLKNKFSYGYSYSKALTDSSIAFCYFEEGNIETAEKHCLRALEYYKKHQSDLVNYNDRIECEKLYDLICRNKK